MKHLIAGLLTVTFTFFQAPDKRLLDLQKEQTKLKGQTDPVAFTKSQIKISGILLAFAGDAAQKGDSEVMEKRLTEYLAAIQDAHKTMMKTGRDAHKKPGGFKELEIAIRRQLILLKDIGGTLTLDERAPVEKAREQAAAIRDDLLKALFGGLDAPGY